MEERDYKIMNFPFRYYLWNFIIHARSAGKSTQGVLRLGGEFP